MDIITILAIIGGLIGIIAGIVQILDYLQKQREKHALPFPRSTTPFLTLSSPDVEQSTLSQLHRQLAQFFDDGELQTLCFDLGLAYEDLPGDTRSDKARELVEAMQRHNRLPDLIQLCRLQRPTITWPDITKAARIPPLPALAVPHNLPRRSSFIGRKLEQDQIHSALRDPNQYAVCIDGIGGIGKSSLALTIAYDCLAASNGETTRPDVAIFAGFIWVSARDRELDLNALIDILALTLDYPGILQQPAETKQVSAEKLLQSASYLLILDNLETVTDTELRRFIRSLPAPSKILITTREQTLNWAQSISLKGLSRSEALTLMRDEGQHLGLPAVAHAVDEILLPLYQATDGSPLAIRWAIGQIKQKGQSIESVLESLHKGRADIFENLFSHAWALLMPDARLLLTVMPLFTAPAQLDAMKAVSDLQDDLFELALGQLVEMWLVEASDDLQASQRRYSIHSLVRAFANNKLEEAEAGWKNAAQRRLAEYFLLLVNDVREREVKWDVWKLVDEQFLNILNGIEWCYAHSKEMTVQFARVLASYLTRRGYWDEALELGSKAREAALSLATEATDTERQRDYQIRAGKLSVWPISWVYRHRHDLDKSEATLLQAITTFNEWHDEEELARARRFLGRTYQERFHLDSNPTHLERADNLLKQALAYYQKPAGKKTSLAHTLLSVGRIAYDRQQYDVALDFAQQSLNLGQEIGFTEGIGATSITLGEIKLAQAEFDQARTYFELGCQKMNEVARVDGVADAIMGLTQVEVAFGNDAEASKLASEALDIYERIGQIQEAKKSSRPVGSDRR